MSFWFILLTLDSAILFDVIVTWAIIQRKSCRIIEILSFYPLCYLTSSRTDGHGLWEWLLLCLYRWQEQKLPMLTASSANAVVPMLEEL